MPFHIVNGLKYYSFDSLDQHGVCNAIFTRHGGVSAEPWKSLNIGGTVGDDPIAVRENLNRIFLAIGRDYSSRYDGWQVHGDTVLRIEQPRPATMAHVKTDGLISNQQEVTLLMRFADCVPVMLYDPVQNGIAIVHAGWKGTMLHIAGIAVKRMGEEFGSRPQDVIACIGPSIGPDDYEVGEEVVVAAQASFGEDTTRIIRRSQHSNYLDLWQANELVLQKAGVRMIEVARISTYSVVEDWFSHRKENGKTGRFGAVIALPENLS
jgi:YfiH family protein